MVSFGSFLHEIILAWLLCCSSKSNLCHSHASESLLKAYSDSRCVSEVGLHTVYVYFNLTSFLLLWFLVVRSWHWNSIYRSNLSVLPLKTLSMEYNHTRCFHINFLVKNHKFPTLWLCTGLREPQSNGGFVEDGCQAATKNSRVSEQQLYILVWLFYLQNVEHC